MSDKSKRPQGLRWLCAGLLTIGIVNLGTALRTLQLASAYVTLPVSFPPELQAAFSLGWGLGMLWAARALWRVHNDSRRWVLLFVGTYGTFQVIWWWIFARSDYARDRWPFAASLAAFVVALVFWYLTRPRVRAWFTAEVSGDSLTGSQT